MPQLSDLLNYGVPVATSAAQGLLGRRAAGSAQRALTQGGQQAIGTIQTGTDKAMETLKGVFEGQKSTLNPFVTAGTDALSKLQEGMAPSGGLTDPFQWMPPDLANDPIFKRRLAEGTKAIEAAGNAGGTRFSGGTMKELADYVVGETNKYDNEDYSRNENTFRVNQASKLGALQWLEGQGQSAANSEVAAGGTYGTNVASLESNSARSIADLQTEIANAEAAGDIAKANQLQGMLGNITSGIQQGRMLEHFLGGPEAGAANTAGGALQSGMAPTLEALGPGAVGPVAANFAPGAAVAAGAGAAGVGAGTAGATTASLAALPTIPGGVAAAAPEVLPGVLAPGAAGTGGLGASLSSQILAFASNPITIGVAGALAAGYFLIKSQAHRTANDWVKNVQNKFVNKEGTGVLNKIVDQFDYLYGSGQLDRDTAQRMMQETDGLIKAYEARQSEFEAKGGKEREVIGNSRRTMNEAFGDGWSKILGKMQQEITGLA